MLNARRYLPVCLLVTVTSCASPIRPTDLGFTPIRRDEGIVLDERFGVVENGCAYDKASIDISSYGKLILPADATVRCDGEPGKLEIYMEKRLGFHGHPPKSMSIRNARNRMGCACRDEGGSLTVATFGEWDSHIEGGAFMRLLFVVPESVEVETDDSLSGEDSKGREWNQAYLTKPKEVEEGYWYGPASPAGGWNAIPDVPDTNLTLYEEAE